MFPYRPDRCSRHIAKRKNKERKYAGSAQREDKARSSQTADKMDTLSIHERNEHMRTALAGK